MTTTTTTATEDISLDGETTIVIDVSDPDEVKHLMFDESQCKMSIYIDEFDDTEEERYNISKDGDQNIIIDSARPGYSKTVRSNVILTRTCSICNKAFENTKQFALHVKESHPPIQVNDQLKCPFCDYYTKLATSAKQHIRTHTVEKPYKCQVCGKAFGQRAGVQQHMRTHSSKKPYRCEICNGRYKTSGTLSAHISMKHDRIRPYSCKECGVSFGHSSNLRTHMRTHTGERPYKCTICNRRFVQHGHLTTHLRLHSGVKPFKCIYCPATFTHAGNLRQHEITQHTKDYKHRCDICEKGFIGPGDLKRHVVSNHLLEDDSSELLENTQDHSYKDKKDGDSNPLASQYEEDFLEDEEYDYIYRCQACFEMFSDPIKLQNHMSQVHETDHVVIRTIPNLAP